MIVCLRLDGFYVKRFAGDGRPLAVLRDKAVLDCDGAARSRGVVPGMAEREARAILFDGRFEQWNGDRHRQDQERWLDACCEFSDAVEPLDQHRAFVDLSPHPRPAEILPQMLSRVAEVSECRVAWGCARVKWMAEAALEEGAGGRAYSDPEGFLKGLRTTRLSPVPVEHRLRLAALGYATAGAAVGLSLEALRAQFGDDAVTVYRCLRGGCAEPVVAAYPPRCASARFHFEAPADNWQAIDAALVRLAGQLGGRLAAEDLQGCELHATIVLEEGERRVARRHAKPMHSQTSVLFGLRRLVGECTPKEALGAGAVGRWTELRVRMPNLQPARRRQANLYTWRASDQTLATEQAIGRLREAFGAGCVVRASEIVEPRRKRVLRAWRDAIGWS